MQFSKNNITISFRRKKLLERLGVLVMYGM